MLGTAPAAARPACGFPVTVGPRKQHPRGLALKRALRTSGLGQRAAYRGKHHAHLPPPFPPFNSGW